MKLFAASAALALLATLAQAAPTPADISVRIAVRSFEIIVTFQGAAGAEFTQGFPGDGRVVRINNPLSISHIVSQGGGTCVFHGIDGSTTFTTGAQQADVGPPQTQISGSCRAF